MKTMKIVTKNFKVFAIALLAVFAFASCAKKQTAVDSGEVESLFAVNTYKTKPGNLDNYLEFGGDVASVTSVAVLPDAAGKIARIMVSVGQMVSRDQTIAYVDPSLPGLNYSLSPVRAPISGRITSFVPTIGTQVSQGSVIAQIAQTDDLEIKVSIPERFISRITMGQEAVVTFDAYPGIEFVAKVFEVSPVLDTTSRTMSVKLRLTKADERVKVGMYARVRLVTESIHDAIVVPSNAIVTRSGKSYLFVVDSKGSGGRNAKVRLTSIVPGLSVDNKTEIAQGISAGDEIVIKGQNLLDDGANVNIISVTED